ncbi:MAG TPA: DUF2249 domain-containing protein [Sediminibacterium sp.]|uniref:DUF2249 domain-containing protein n=1 Tax=Sediminibacterium sp. TaxID=1917865 RepID=UPI0008AD5D29|nr:DUF2249 domain-containing protein [Sediminibacterium sp.]OHC84319.1 MAG: hypothetical protein A2472_12740 [Sphingobacteriia bacterium RIFOXYC2_FULL_35_18]OHC88733.1 MAG: hypothetical protein A2546_02440 [Sphingobacteriia bacterium RIFOXYD2_FULL_35_12]HLD53931.1 DUF2249 domain-containing protein [Sediminibacterium sp.]
MNHLNFKNITTLDVRPILASGVDPLNVILNKVKELENGFVLKIINGFEPTPLIRLLNKQGFEAYVEKIDDFLVHTFFYKISDKALFVDTDLTPNLEVSTSDWESKLKVFENNIETLDVRNFEMPLPMHSILNALNNLSPNSALFVYHKRIPLFLLPELKEQNFSFLIKEISHTEVHLLIFKD